MSTTDISERFQRETAEHEMTVLHEDGLYRHVRFMHVATDPETGKRSRSSFYWFDLLTWPGCLAINGDCGSYVFSRIEDMFTFFTGSRINPGYWAEKVRSGQEGLKTYTQDRLRELIADHIGDPRGDEECAAKDWPGLAEAIEHAFFEDTSFLAEWDTCHEQGAREALDGFKFGDTWTFTCGCGEQAEGLTETDACDRRRVHQRRHYSSKPEVALVEGFRFTDTWEWDLRDWDWQFLWCCHAIQWGIARYSRERAAMAAGGAS